MQADRRMIASGYIYRAVQELSFDLLAAGGRCDPYVDKTAARTRGAASRPGCLLTWQASLFSQRGTRVNLTPQQYTLTTVEPPVPTIDLIGEQPLDKTLLAVPQAGGKLGAVQVKAPTGGLTLTVAVPGQEPKQERYEPNPVGVELAQIPVGHPVLLEKRDLVQPSANLRRGGGGRGGA